LPQRKDFICAEGINLPARFSLPHSFLEAAEVAGTAGDLHALALELTNLRCQLFIGFSPRGQCRTLLGFTVAVMDFENATHTGVTKVAMLCLHKRVLHHVYLECSLLPHSACRALCGPPEFHLEPDHLGLARLNVTQQMLS